MLRPEVEYWATPEAYIRQLNKPARPEWYRALMIWMSVAIEKRRSERARRPRPIQGTIPAYIRQDIGLPPRSDFPWYRDSL